MAGGEGATPADAAGTADGGDGAGPSGDEAGRAVADEFDPWAIGGPAGDDATSMPGAVGVELAALAEDEDAIGDAIDELAEQVDAGLAVDA